jgi:hypothetical protein
MENFIPGFDDPEDEESGYFDDEGNRLNPDLVTKPGLCLLCVNADENDEFKCGAFRGREEP